MSKKISRIKSNLPINEEGGGLGTLFIGLSVILLILMIFINIADYSLYTYKRNEVSKAMDYAVTAASQQIKAEHLEEMSKGFSDTSGKKLLEGVEINMSTASAAFNEIFYRNVSLSSININNNLLLCSTTLTNGSLKYTIHANGSTFEQGEIKEPSELENIINTALSCLWPDSDKTGIYINGNPRTNMVERGIYLFAVISDIEIKGLISKRKISLSSFAGAKLERGH